jgi:hypothetical protein
MSTESLRTKAQRLREALPPRRQSTPPQEQGQRLATIPRPRDDAEVRINWCEYDGHPYVAIRFWVKGNDGQMWPDKHRGFSVRLHELPDVADAIGAALELAHQHSEGRPASRGSVAGRRVEGSAAAPRPSHGGTCGPANEFDEFNP